MSNRRFGSMLSLLALLWVPVAAEHSGVYAEKIPADGGFALHHVGIAQLGLAASRRALTEAGIEAVVEVENPR
jgi:hypothetical protein